MEIEVKLATPCTRCQKTRKGATITLRKTLSYATTVTFCTYCVIEIVTALLTPIDRKPKQKEKGES